MSETCDSDLLDYPIDICLRIYRGRQIIRVHKKAGIMVPERVRLVYNCIEQRLCTAIGHYIWAQAATVNLTTSFENLVYVFEGVNAVLECLSNGAFTAARASSLDIGFKSNTYPISKDKAFYYLPHALARIFLIYAQEIISYNQITHELLVC